MTKWFVFCLVFLSGFAGSVGIAQAQSCSAILDSCIASGMRAPGCVEDLRACQTRFSPRINHPKRCFGGLAKCMGVDQIHMIDGPRPANIQFVNGSVRRVTLKIPADANNCLNGGEFGHEEAIAPNRVTDYLTSIHVKTSAACKGRTAHFAITPIMDDYARQPQKFALGSDGELRLEGEAGQYESILTGTNNGNYRWTVVLPDLLSDTACPANKDQMICNLGKAIEAQAKELCPTGDRKGMMKNCLLTRGQCLGAIPGYATGNAPRVYDDKIEACNVHAEACMIGCDIVAEKSLRQDVANYMLKTCPKDGAMTKASACFGSYQACKRALPDAEKYESGIQKLQAAGAALIGSYDCQGALYQCSHACDKP